MKSKKKQTTPRDQRRLRLQQILFTVFAVILILSFVISFIAPY